MPLPTLALLALASIAWSTASAATIVEKRTAASTDDAEEFANGTMYLTSSDLELIHDSSDQTVGMRWTGLAIPPGATITAAYVQFAAKESQSEATDVTFRAEAADAAATFDSTPTSISTRPRTTASTSWVPVAWVAGEAGANQRTPDLAAVIQEVVSRPGWASGNALVLIVTGSGHRCAWSFDGKPSAAPLLHVEYTTGPPPENPPVASLTVTQLASPPLTVNADGSGSTDVDATPIASYQFDFGDGAVVTTTAPAATAQHTYGAAGTYTVTLIVTDTGNHPSTPVTQDITVSPSASATTIEKRTVASSDDAEESSSGSVSLSSSDLELIHDSSDQTVGMRWTSVAIPPGSTITAAYVQFAAKESQSEATSLALRAQAADDATTFTTSSTNVSSRPRTAALVNWAPAAWVSGEAGASQRTPDLSAVFQEVVSRSGWASGHALALIVTGTGHRTAWSYDGNHGAAPLLHLEFVNTPPPENPPVARLTVTKPSGPLTVQADGSASTDVDATPIESYRFEFGDGAVVTTTAPTATAQHTYGSAGTYTVRLTCTDTGGHTSAPATASVTVTAGSSGQIAVFAGYYDTHHDSHLRTKPSPWQGSADVVFVGTPDSKSGGWDSSALRIDNLTTGALTVTTTVDIGSHHFALWGARTIPVGYRLILAQTSFENFDGSDLNAAGCFDCNPNDCLTKVSSTIPVIHVTMNGTTTDYRDADQVLNTNGADLAGCPYTGTRNDESTPWQQVFPGSSPAAPSARAALDVDRGRPVLFAPYPNPVRGILAVEFKTTRQGEVQLAVYDLAGRMVRSSVNGLLDAGQYRDLMNLAGLAPGIYYCRLTTPEGMLHRAFTLVR